MEEVCQGFSIFQPNFPPADLSGDWKNESIISELHRKRTESATLIFHRNADMRRMTKRTKSFKVLLMFLKLFLKLKKGSQRSAFSQHSIAVRQKCP